MSARRASVFDRRRHTPCAVTADGTRSVSATLVADGGSRLDHTLTGVFKLQSE